MAKYNRTFYDGGEKFSVEVTFRQSSIQSQVCDRIVEIVRDKPGISRAKIREIYYEGKASNGRNINSTIDNLCMDNKIECRSIDSYFVVGA
ncbi:MAG: hypothetical protein ACRCZS_02400 [Chroococcidiopsis sp.]